MGKNDIEEKIENELIDLALPIEGNAFLYWKELLLAIYNDKFEVFNMHSYYLFLAEKYNKSWQAVERILRYGISKMKKNIRKKYNIKTNITNGTLIALFQLKIF